MEVVLTAHPTQVNRRTLQYKHTRICALLQQNDRCAAQFAIIQLSEGRDGGVNGLICCVNGTLQMTPYVPARALPICSDKDSCHNRLRCIGITVSVLPDTHALQARSYQ